MMNRAFKLIILVAAFAVSGCGNEPNRESPSTQPARAGIDQTGGGILPAGTYEGVVMMPGTTIVQQWQYSPVTRSGSVVPTIQPTITPSPFAGGNLQLDGQGVYRMPRAGSGATTGNYTFDEEHRTIEFSSGPLAGCAGTVSLNSDGAASVNTKVPAGEKDGKPASLDVTFSNPTPNPGAVKPAGKDR